MTANLSPAPRAWALLLLVLTLLPAARATAAGPIRVAVVAPAAAPGRLADELAQELGASGFSVARHALPAQDPRSFAEGLLWPTSGGDPAAARADACAVVANDDRGVTIYVRGPGGTIAMVLSELSSADADRPSRRRLSLAVVERLRQVEGSAAPAPAAPLDPAAAAPPPERPSSGPVTAAPPLPVVAAAAPPGAPGPRSRWAFGASSALNLLSPRGTPTGHIVLTAERAIARPLDFVTRASWPILGAQFHDPEGRFVRTWTFDVEAGVNLRLLDRASRFTPVIGVAGGVRLALVDAEFEFRGAEVRLTPAVTGAVIAGLRYEIRSSMHLFLEGALSQGRAFFSERRSFERDTAAQRLLRVALGVLFEY